MDKTKKVINATQRASIIINRHKRCELCGWNNVPLVLEIHHKISKKDGGGNEDENLILLCPNCHSIEHWKKAKVKTPEELLSKTYIEKFNFDSNKRYY